MFDDVPLLPPDPILGLLSRFRADPRTDKIDLGVGVYQDEEGRTPVMRAVQEAESRLLLTQTTKTYQGIAGDPEFNERMLAMLLGPQHPALRDGRVRGVQTPGGCGALRIGAEVIRRARPAARVWVSSPTWANHMPLIGGSGLELVEYPYYDPVTRGVDFDAMMSALANVPAGDVVLLHGCCHNPCGADLNHAMWQAVAEAALKQGFTPFIDLAYQGLGDGLDEDVYGLRLLASKLPEVIVASSYSKNFGLYRERTGAVMVLAETAAAAEASASQVIGTAREMYSVPPAHGAALVGMILDDAALRSEWDAELTEMRDRINGLRVQLVAKLTAKGVNRDFSFIQHEKGMFSFLGLTPEQVKKLIGDYSIYLVGSSRINVAGINKANLDYLVNAIAAVL